MALRFAPPERSGGEGHWQIPPLHRSRATARATRCCRAPRRRPPLSPRPTPTRSTPIRCGCCTAARSGPGRGHVRGQLLHRHQPGDQGPRHFLQGGRLPAHPAPVQGARLRDRDRGRAVDRQGPPRRLLLRRDLRLRHRRGQHLRPLVPGEPSGRDLRRAGPAHAADRDDLVQGALAEPAPLRRRRHRPSHPAAMGADRLAAAADPHGAILGGAADPPPELPLHLPIRAGTGAALAVRRAAPAGAPAGRPADPQTRVCRGRLFSAEDYRIDVQTWGFADVVGPATAETDG